MAIIMDGKALAAQMRAQLAGDVSTLKLKTGVTPGLAVVIVGENPASQVYVRTKGREAQAAGMNSFHHALPGDVTQEQLLALVHRLNADPHVHGILVQLPLPDALDSQSILQAVDPAKDVDGFHPLNAGRLSLGTPGLTPCTPQGCLRLLKHYVPETLAGKTAVVLGRSNIVG